MYRVEVKNPCRCFFRSGMVEQQTFATLAEAQEEAESMQAQMLRDFCKKHDFLLTRTGLTFTITIVPSR